jgi:hypothetical protein
MRDVVRDADYGAAAEPNWTGRLPAPGDLR